MNAFELLKADHKVVGQLFDELEAARGNAKLGIFQQIKNELELHTHIEETIFYPALEKPEETHDLTLEAYEEHKVVKTLLAELAGAKSADDEWQAKAKVLRENVEHHVNEEENELFDKADDALSAEQIEALGERMERAKAKKQGKPAPKQSAGKTSKSTKASTAKPGILSKIATFVGLGGEGASNKHAASKTKPAQRKTASKSAAKAGTSKASAKKAAGKASGKSAKKSSKPSVTKRTSAATGYKRVAKKKSGRK